MADRISPNRKNRLSPKEIAKRTAALTLLLSTVACSGSPEELVGGFVLFIIGYNILAAIVDYFESKKPDHSVEDYERRLRDNDDMYHKQ
jgi:hypothetical protein